MENQEHSDHATEPLEQQTITTSIKSENTASEHTLTQPNFQVNTSPNRNETEQHAILELMNVSYAYTKGGKQVLQHICHHFEQGKVYAVTGPSGAGKTTLLSIISGLTNPTEGKVLYEGKNLASVNRYKYRSRDIGVIFQSFNLLPSLNVLENIMLSMDASGKHFEEPKKQIALRLLGLVHLPEEYAQERVLHLSGGEQQRVAIARAFSYNPQIIVADEPTGNLDSATQEDIMSIFRSLAEDENRCVIIVTHSPQVAQACDEIYELAPIRHTAHNATRNTTQRTVAHSAMK